MSVVKKSILGILSILPSLYIVFFIVLLLYVTSIPHLNNEIPVGLRGYVVAGFVLELSSVFIILGLILYYALCIAKNIEVSQNTKIIWILSLFCLSIFTIPAYWFMYIRKE